MTEIIFHNKTKKIEACTVIIDGKKIIFEGEKAKEIAKMANTDLTSIKNFIESIVL